jgi:hypothetical protein
MQAGMQLRLGMLLEREGRNGEARREYEAAERQLAGLVEKDRENVAVGAMLDRAKKRLEQLSK